MKQISIALVLFLTLGSHTCNKKTMEAAGGGDAKKGAEMVSSIMDNKWVLGSIEGNAIKMPDGMEAPWLKLTKDGSKLEGFGGCNNIFGGFELAGDGIRFPNLASTKKYCEAVQPTENAFLSALRSTDHFKIDGSTLKLLAGTRELAALTPE